MSTTATAKRRKEEAIAGLDAKIQADEKRLAAYDLADSCTFDDLQGRFLEAVRDGDQEAEQLIKLAIEISKEGAKREDPPPLPLVRHTIPAEPFPLEAFPLIMRNAAERMIEVIQSPQALTGQSLLAAATLAAQAHVNLMIDGRVSAASNNFLTIGESGERKSANDREANRATQERQKQDHHKAVAGHVELEADQLAWDATRRRIANDRKLSHDEIKTELEALGERPSASSDMRYTEEPTYEGLVRTFADGNLSMGLFSDEGGRFLGGFAMNQDNAVKTITGLSKLWDGDPVTRSRGGDGNTLIYNVRLSVHLMMQPIIADKVFSDPLLSGQGFLSRCLCAYPESTIGNRPYKEMNLNNDALMIPYHDRMREIIEIPYPMGSAGMGLEPRALTLAPEAKRVWIAFHDHVEGLMKDGAPLRPVKGFASKAAEHAARLAAVLAFFDDTEVAEISPEHIEAGITLSEYYLGEALRLFNSATTNPDLLLAEKVLTWAQTPDRNGVISLTDLYQKGPSQLRTKAAAMRIIEILADHHRIIQVNGGCQVNGSFKRDVWRVRA
jgi:uncharacterized protein YecT (DUF1311 family)